MPPVNLTAAPFAEAAKAWLESRRPYISAKTFHEYGLNIKTLTAFFQEMRLGEITADQIRAYQKFRLAQCGPFSINHECSVLQQMLKRIGRWTQIASDYQPLPLPKEERGRALSDDQRKKLLETAGSNPNWEAAYCFALISMNTTAGPKETYTLRLKDADVSVDEPQIRVQPAGAKNIHRIRGIDMNDEALMGVNLAIARARRLGSTEPDHYLFPFRIPNTKRYDPTRHQTTFKTAWKKLIVAAGLQGLRMYDLRHHAITVLLEDPEVSEETAEYIAGHISRRMKKRYSHTRRKAVRAAVAALCPQATKKPPQPERKIPTDSTASTEADTIALAKQMLALASKLLKRN